MSEEELFNKEEVQLSELSLTVRFLSKRLIDVTMYDIEKVDFVTKSVEHDELLTILDDKVVKLEFFLSKLTGYKEFNVDKIHKKSRFQYALIGSLSVKLS
jgi:hypothetical protein